MNTPFNFLIALFILFALNVNGQNNTYIVKKNGEKLKCKSIEAAGDSLKFSFNLSSSSVIQTSTLKSEILYYSINGAITNIASPNRISGKLLYDSGVMSNNALGIAIGGSFAGSAIGLSVNPIIGGVVFGIMGIIAIVQKAGANSKLKQAGEILMQAP